MPSIVVKNLTTNSMSVGGLLLTSGQSGAMAVDAARYEAAIAELEVARNKGYISYVQGGAPGASLELVVGVLTAGAISVTGTILGAQLAVIPAVKQVFFKAQAPIGPVAITIQAGTVVSGNGTDTVWAATTAGGLINFTVENATHGEVALIEVKTEYGTTSYLKLQF